MITNATLISHATPTANAAGKVTWAAATALGVRCALVSATAKDAAALGVTLKDVSAVLYVLKNVLPVGPGHPAGFDITAGEKLVASIDNGLGSKTYRVVHARNQEKSGGLAHFECFLQEVA